MPHGSGTGLRQERVKEAGGWRLDGVNIPPPPNITKGCNANEKMKLHAKKQPDLSEYPYTRCGFTEPHCRSTWNRMGKLDDDRTMIGSTSVGTIH
ncbi:ABC transporter ATP-binding protein [Marssonina coronariae]|uniref:ABC transporter ATP-binding protein n=1 Tax=Diplocarpon coronariae TaxID=2795749 RepID=A0A218Z5C5_9HELO|nr:ABC transporter ATP-binding protein [Marssonina coronariae]